MTHLPNAPLVYTLGLVRFPAIPLDRLDHFAALFHDAIRAEMPLLDDIQLQQMQVDFGPDGVKVNPVPLKFWQFALPDRKFALVLSRDSLALHTNSYRDHQSFIARFTSALTKLVAIPEIGIDWVTGIAMRYVDLIRPQNGFELDSLLLPSVLPPAFSGVADLHIVEGVYVAQYRTQKANVRFQILRNPQSALPPDLDTLLIGRNSWGPHRPETEFAVVDTDCASPITDAIPLDIPTVSEHMYSLRFVAKSIFNHIGTNDAKSLWEGKST